MMMHLLRNALADTSTMMLTMKTWLESGGFNVQLRSLEDYEFSLRIAANYNVCYFHEPLVTTYYSEDSVNQNWKEGTKTYFYVLKEFSEQYRKNECIKWEKILLIWTKLKMIGEGRFFEEQLLKYVKESGEDIRQMEERMQHFIMGHTLVD